MGSQTVFEQVNALPRTEDEAAARDWNRHLNGGQRCADVRRHVVRPLVAMTEELVAIGHETNEEALEIATHVRIRILLHDEFGEVDEEGQQSVFNAGPGGPSATGRVISTKPRPVVLMASVVWN